MGRDEAEDSVGMDAAVMIDLLKDRGVIKA